MKKIEVGEQTNLSDSSVELLKDVPEIVTSCLDGLTRVGDIVKSLNTFSRQNNEDFSQININEVILSALKIVDSRANGNLEQELAPQLSLITGNFGQLQQVLVNLLINAMDSIADNINGKVSITSYQDTEAIIVEVVDNGIGMDNKTLKRLFDPFFTTKPEGKGTGLGLSVSYAIMMKHKGLLSVKSKQDKGTQFTLTFPLVIEF